MTKYIAHILPASNIHDEGTEIPFGDNYAEYADSIVRWVQATAPNMLIEHEPDGLSHGVVNGIYVTPEGLFAEFTPDPSVPMDMTRFVSPRVRWHHTDVHGTYWPAALLELSFVSVPRFNPGQQPIVELSQWNRPIDSMFSAITNYSAVNPQPTGVTMTPEMLAEIKRMIDEAVALAVTASAPAAPAAEVAMEEAPVEIEIEAPEAEVPEAPAVTPELLMGMDAPARAEALAPLAPEVKAEVLMALSDMLLQKQEESVMSAIKGQINSRNIPAGAHAGLIKLAKTDRKAYESALSAFPITRKTPNAPVAVANDLTSKAKRAESIAKEKGISYSEAFKLV